MIFTYRPIKGADLRAVINDLAALRIRVFADYPYCYVGDAEYEARYLRPYEDSDTTLLIGCYHHEQIVGMSTGTGMEVHADEFREGFAKSNIEPRDVFYCAESVLLPQYRGHGAGRVFFEMREAYARKLGRKYATFCAVVRDEHDPRRPNDYLPLDEFWGRLGYKKMEAARAIFHWAEEKGGEDIPHQMQFWIKDLNDETR